MPAPVDQPKKFKMMVSSRALEVPGMPKNPPKAIKRVDRVLSTVAPTPRMLSPATPVQQPSRQTSKTTTTMQKSTQPDTGTTFRREAPARECRPTERENYRRDELTELMARREDRDKRTKDKARKALRAAYRENPSEFEVEPAELHSEADLEEEVMFTDREVTSRLTAKKTLQYSSKKIPMSATLTTEMASIPLQRERQVQMMEADLTDGEESSETTPVVTQTKKKGNKRNRENSVSDPTNSKVAKVQKTTASDMPPEQPTSSNSLRAANLPPVTKEVFGVAVSVFRSLICAKAPFPATAIEETCLAQEAWKVACQRKGIEVPLPPTAMTLLLKRTSQVRGELKTKIRSLVGPFFGFRASDTRDIIKRNRDRAESLKEGSRFTFKDWENRKGIYKSDLIQLSINQMWFANKNDEGVIFARYFNPIPIKTIALVLAAIECCIDEWASGVKTDINFSAAAYGDVYREHVKQILVFDEHTAAYDLLGRIQQTLHDVARCYSGAEPIKSVTNNVRAVDSQAFQDAMDEYEQEIQENAPEDGFEDTMDGEGEHRGNGDDEGTQGGKAGGSEGDHDGKVQVEGEGEFEGIEDGGEGPEDGEEGPEGEIEFEDTQ